MAPRPRFRFPFPEKTACPLRWMLLAAGVAIWPALAVAHEATVCSQDGAVPQGYVPPPVSNGSISLQVDYQGCQFHHTYVKLVPEILWAGRRYGPPKDQLVSFGHFEQTLTAGGRTCGKPTRWQQTLDTDSGLVRCRCDYGDALRVETTVFVPLDQDLVAVHKRLVPGSAAPRSARIDFTYHFSAPGKKDVTPRRVAMREPKAGAAGIEIPYALDGYQACEGMIGLSADGPVTPQIDRQTFCLSAELALDAARPAEITYYLLFADSLDGKDYTARMARMKSLVAAQGYEGLLAAHRAQWARYWADSYVRLPAAERMERAYYTSQYHLRINTTRWSIPVGLFNTHWAGHYFAWDEMFGFLGLASSNHLAISQRVPDFRHQILPVALKRMRHYRMGESYGARYSWQDLEDGGEGTSPGFWQDHVFPMGNVAVSAWYQYLYTGDLKYLEAKSYPIIKECATFYQRNMIYAAPNGQLIFGLCTDLERLGPARLNPFLTSCSAIFSLETAARAAGLLKVDADRAEQWKTIAARLRESLPNDGRQYVPSSPPLELAVVPARAADAAEKDSAGWRNVRPQPGRPEVSVAVLGGLFPYPLFGSDNALQKNAAYWYIGQGSIAGNMYPVGKSICAWYGGWMACALVALGDRDKPAEILSRVADDAGLFHELFEINEPGVAVMHPWFSTGEGNYVYAVNQMLLACREEQIRIAPAVPEAWRDFAFKLPCFGNLLATVAAKDGRLVELTFTPGDPSAMLTRTVIVPQRLLDPQAVSRAAVSSTAVRDGCLRLEVKIQGPTAVLGR